MNVSAWRLAAPYAAAAMLGGACAGAVAIAPALAATGASQSVPAQSVPAQRSLDSVSCVSRLSCVAVGQRVTTSNRDLNFAESWNGSKWRTLPQPPSPGSLDGLLAVSCTGPTACIAVGGYVEGTKPSARSLALAERWNGRAWTVLPVRDPGPSINLLTTVSCTAADSCVAVGWYGSGDLSPLLAEHWNGSSWQLMKTKATPTVQWSGLSCATAASCVAVGSSQGPGSTAGLVTAVWNGAAWQPADAPAPAGRFVGLASVSCASAAGCIAVGNYVTIAGAPKTLAEAWNGRRWRELAALTPAGTRGGAGLHGVWCVRPDSCVAIGGADQVLLSEEWNGHAWRMTRAKGEPGTDVASNLLGISCWQARGCMAVGDYFGLSGVVYPLAEDWNGTAWRLLPAG
jgi:hypothetical protein